MEMKVPETIETEEGENIELAREDATSPEMVKLSAAMLTDVTVENLTAILANPTKDKFEEEVKPLKVIELSKCDWKKKLPKENCPEKMIFCLDVCPDKRPFLLQDKYVSPLTMMKRVVGTFARNKSNINSNHEFGLMSMYHESSWVGSFTRDVDQLIESMNTITEVSSQARCNLSSLFNFFLRKVTLPVKPNPEHDTPQYIIRLVLMYARSSVIPRFQDDAASFLTLKTSPYFFLDVVYLHQVPSPAYLCQDVYEALCELCDESSYIFDVVRNVLEFENNMAKMLSHPLQREQLDYLQLNKEKQKLHEKKLKVQEEKHKLLLEKSSHVLK